MVRRTSGAGRGGVVWGGRATTSRRVPLALLVLPQTSGRSSLGPPSLRAPQDSEVLPWLLAPQRSLPSCQEPDHREGGGVAPSPPGSAPLPSAPVQRWSRVCAACTLDQSQTQGPAHPGTLCPCCAVSLVSSLGGLLWSSEPSGPLLCKFLFSQASASLVPSGGHWWAPGEKRQGEDVLARSEVGS